MRTAVAVHTAVAMRTAVIARLDRATQYAEASVVESREFGVLGPPPSRGTTRGEPLTALTGRKLYKPQPHAFFFTSLMLEKVMPSARSLV